MSHVFNIASLWEWSKKAGSHQVVKLSSLYRQFLGLASDSGRLSRSFSRLLTTNFESCVTTPDQIWPVLLYTLKNIYVRKSYYWFLSYLVQMIESKPFNIKAYCWRYHVLQKVLVTGKDKKPINKIWICRQFSYKQTKHWW